MARMQSVPLLSVSPADADHAALRELLADTQWQLSEARSLGSALRTLRHDPISLILCERDLQPGTWKDLLDQISVLPSPPSLIVTSRHANEELWVEALDAGAYDLLAKPFDAREFHRTLFQAWLRWQVQYETVAGEQRVLAAAV